jgi:hypothetical protein
MPNVLKRVFTAREPVNNLENPTAVRGVSYLQFVSSMEEVENTRTQSI